jgi:hypothetical protein
MKICIITSVRGEALPVTSAGQRLIPSLARIPPAVIDDERFEHAAHTAKRQLLTTVFRERESHAKD